MTGVTTHDPLLEVGPNGNSPENNDFDDVHDAADEETNKEGWDEGGKSDCGYSDGFHDTLMSIGSTVHEVVGEPSESIQETMNQIGTWFQEASYVMRDIKQGKMNVGEETLKAVQSFVPGDEGDLDDDADDGDSKEKLQNVNEDD